MSEIERLNMIAEWQEQHKQLIEDLDNSKKRIAELEKQIEELKVDNKEWEKASDKWKANYFELKAENELIKNSDSLCKLIGEQKLQIEKMKCCMNCLFFTKEGCRKEIDGCRVCSK